MSLLVCGHRSGAGSMKGVMSAALDMVNGHSSCSWGFLSGRADLNKEKSLVILFVLISNCE